MAVATHMGLRTMADTVSSNLGGTVTSSHKTHNRAYAPLGLEKPFVTSVNLIWLLSLDTVFCGVRITNIHRPKTWML